MNNLNKGGQMKKFSFLLTVFIFMGVNVIADGHESSYEPYKAEYYVGKLLPGKTMDDMVKWAMDWKEWADKSGMYDNYNVNLMVPYFINDGSTHDLMWYGRYPNSTEQFAGLDYWVNNGQKLAAKLPLKNNLVVEVWQRDVSVPEGEPGQTGYVMYQDCRLDEGVTGNDVYEAYYAYAKAARELGDNLGRKMMWPVTGTSEAWNYDFIVVMYANSLAEYGVNNDLFWDQINGKLEENKALGEVGYQCYNRRSYTTMNIK